MLLTQRWLCPFPLVIVTVVHWQVAQFKIHFWQFPPCSPQPLHQHIWLYILLSPLHTGQKKKPATKTGFCLRWGRVQSAFIPGSNDSIYRLLLWSSGNIMETWHPGGHTNFLPFLEWYDMHWSSERCCVNTFPSISVEYERESELKDVKNVTP